MKKDTDEVIPQSALGIDKQPNEIGLIDTRTMYTMYGDRGGEDILKVLNTAKDAVLYCPAFITDRSIITEIVRKKMAVKHPDLTFPVIVKDPKPDGEKDVLHYLAIPELCISFYVSYKLTVKERWLDSIGKSFAFGIGIHIVEGNVFHVIADGGIEKPDKYSIIIPDCHALLEPYMDACIAKMNGDKK